MKYLSYHIVINGAFHASFRNFYAFRESTKFYSADGEVIKTFTAYKFEKVEIKDVPDSIKFAIIATERK